MAQNCKAQVPLCQSLLDDASLGPVPNAASRTNMALITV